MEEPEAPDTATRAVPELLPSRRGRWRHGAERL